MIVEYLRVSKSGRVGRIQLDRPKVYNALNQQVMWEVAEALAEMDQDPDIRCVIITGDERAFAAGADIQEMADASSVEMLSRDQFTSWTRIRAFSKPLIAAVSGFALGGGCELAMACDLIIASETAKFGQPEINIGVMPGAGGTQRLTRAVGKARAMEMVLTGTPITAEEAYEAGLINRVVPVEVLEQEAMKLAEKIAAKAPVAVRLAKQSVLNAFETHLDNGLQQERNLFYLLFATEDQKEGMNAFVEKRSPQFRGR